MSIAVSQYIQIPKEGVPPKEKRDLIEQSLPAPRVIPGWKFKGYVWPRVKQLRTRNKDGNSDNTVRLGGTKDHETLEVTIPKGVDVTKHPPSLRQDGEEQAVLNGFNRTKEIPVHGYEHWIYAEYEEDLSTRTEFQDTTEDAVDDLRATFNRDEGAVTITEEEIKELIRNRFASRIDFESGVTDADKDAMVRYVESLDLNLSGNKEKGLVNSVIKQFKRVGRVEAYTRDEAETFVNNGGFGADLINTKDTTRVLRLWKKIMLNYIACRNPLKLIDYSTGATSHEMIDKDLKEVQEELEELYTITIRFVSLVLVDKITDPLRRPWTWFGSIYQKIGTPKPSNGLVKHD